jgi:hypothetical protein
LSLPPLKGVWSFVQEGLKSNSSHYRAFWDIAQCSLVGVYDVSEVRTVSITALIVEAACTSETSVYWVRYSNKTTRRYIPEGYNLHTRRRENLKSHAETIYLATWFKSVKGTFKRRTLLKWGLAVIRNRLSVPMLLSLLLSSAFHMREPASIRETFNVTTQRYIP